MLLTVRLVGIVVICVGLTSWNGASGCSDDDVIEIEQCDSTQKDCKSKSEDMYSEQANLGEIHTNETLVFTVATDETDGFQRYLFSAREFGINPIVLGLGEKWKGGDDIKHSPGGGWKINLLKTALEPYKDDASRIVIFTDGYDVLFLSNLEEILKKFKNKGARVLFGAEVFCWPKAELADHYPEVKRGKRYLNSGLFMGFATEMYELLTWKPVEDKDDDQLYFTEAYLDVNFRKKLKIQLDHDCDIFQNLNGAAHEVELFDEDRKNPSYKILKNVVEHTQPLIVHGNGPSKIYLNSFSNYLAHAWHPEEGCRHCELGMIRLDNLKELPIVLLALFIEYPTPFLEEHLEKISNLDYPKKRIHLFVHNSAKYHSDNITSFITKYKDKYLSVKQIKPEDETTEWTARDLSLEQCLQKNCEYYFAVDSVAHLDNPATLKLLIQQNRSVVAPLLVRPGKAWSNFWGALTSDGYYARSSDYMDIVHNNRRGLWNVPFINNCYLVNATILRRHGLEKIKFVRENLDADMSFCANLRDLDVHMYLNNRLDFGHLVNADTFDITMAVPDLYQIFENEMEWEQRYIHPDYQKNFSPDQKPVQPCPDVYWFPIVTRRFCNDLIRLMESYGKWSSGTNDDERLEGGYEAVPTRDIHMTQVAWDRHWLQFLARYVRPLQESVFTGYYHNPPRSLMNFVVRYRPDEQSSLRPHHDTSTYTINIALNERGVDYEGGGCRFIRYNCSVVDTRPGWMLMHPGRLTHFHEGLLVTRGTRYIMVSFVDP